MTTTRRFIQQSYHRIILGHTAKKAPIVHQLQARGERGVFTGALVSCSLHLWTAVGIPPYMLDYQTIIKTHEALWTQRKSARECLLKLLGSEHLTKPDSNLLTAGKPGLATFMHGSWTTLEGPLESLNHTEPSGLCIALVFKLKETGRTSSNLYPGHLPQQLPILSSNHCIEHDTLKKC